MTRIFISLLIALSLVSCTKVVPYYKPEIQQGNILNPSLIAQLKPGMSQEDVTQLLGTPVLNNPYNNNQLTYIYTDQKNREPYVQHELILQFKQNKLIHAQGDYAEIPARLKA